MGISKEYLIKEYCKKKNSMKKIAKDNGTSPQTIMRRIHQYGLPVNKKEKAWNSGKTYKDDSRILAKEKHPRHKHSIYYSSDFKRLRKKILPCKCDLCDNEAKLLHHKDKNKMNNDIINLQPLCRNCHTSLHNKERGITVYKHHCDWCGNLFEVYHNKKCKQKFCSLTCKAKYNYHNKNNSIKIRNSRKKKEYLKECLWCKKIFKTSRKNQKLCSYSCSSLYSHHSMPC